MDNISGLRKWPIGAAVNKYKKEMAKGLEQPKPQLTGTTGVSTGVKSSIPQTNGPQKLMKFPMNNYTTK